MANELPVRTDACLTDMNVIIHRALAMLSKRTTTTTTSLKPWPKVTRLERRKAFLLGFHKRIGGDSSIYTTLQCNSIFDANLLSVIFGYVDATYSQPKKTWRVLNRIESRNEVLRKDMCLLLMVYLRAGTYNYWRIMRKYQQTRLCGMLYRLQQKYNIQAKVGKRKDYTLLTLPRIVASVAPMLVKMCCDEISQSIKWQPKGWELFSVSYNGEVNIDILKPYCTPVGIHVIPRSYNELANAWREWAKGNVYAGPGYSKNVVERRTRMFEDTFFTTAQRQDVYDYVIRTCCTKK